METIKNYLETMFKNLPQSPEVLKAKSELEQMMEDKYTELIKEGKSENEAVGIVISEFGNLEELAADLGIEQIYKNNQTISRKKVSFEEAQNYLSKVKSKAILSSLGKLLCICCVTGPIIADSFQLSEIIKPLSFFIILAAGIVLLILSRTKMEQWNFLKKEPCEIDQTTVNFVKEKKRDFSTIFSILISVGILFCIFSFVIAAFMDNSKNFIMQDLSGAFFFLFVGIGVFILSYAKIINTSYKRILNINQQTDFKETKEEKSRYKNKTVSVIMECYWQTVTCLYLCISFLTFAWNITWIIWVIAAPVNKIIAAAFSENKEEE